MTVQNRLPLQSPLGHAAIRRVGTMVCDQIVNVTASGSADLEYDLARCDATGGAIVLTLPAGSDGIIGKRFAAVKTDATANAVTIARSGSTDTIEGATSIATTVQHGRLEVYWDGAIWRRVSSPASSGSSTINGNLTVTGTSALVGATTMGSGGTAAVFTPGLSVLDLAKSFQVTGQIFSTQLVSAPLLIETKAAEVKLADTPFSLAAGDRMLTISTTGAGANAITAGDTLEVGQEVFILMTAFNTGTYTMALTGGLTATFGAAGDSLHIKHFGGGVWASMGGTAVVA